MYAGVRMYRSSLRLRLHRHASGARLPPVGPVWFCGFPVRPLLAGLVPGGIGYGPAGLPIGGPPATPEFAKFAPGRTSVTLAPRPSFLAKNEREHHRLRPVTVPAWFVDSAPHPLCPVSALTSYLAVTSRAPGQHLWVDPVSLGPLKTAAIARGLTTVIRLADPSAPAKAHHVRKIASSLAFFRALTWTRSGRLVNGLRHLPSSPGT